MNNLQTVTHSRIQRQTADPLAELPQWLRYLVGAFPAAKVSVATFAVLEDQFSDTDPALMLQVVRRAVRSHLFASFPAVGELRRVVEGLEYDTAVANRQSVNLNRARALLIEGGYRGEIDPAEWQQLHRFFIAHKRLSGAAWLANRFEQFTGTALAGGHAD